MPPPSYKLYTSEASFRAFGTLIAAEYNGVDVVVSTDTNAASKSPAGKLPFLELPRGKGTIISSHAAARYVAGIRPDTGLLGRNLTEMAAIDAWMDWCIQEVELPACIWFYPVAGYMPFNQSAYDKAKVDFGNALGVLNRHLTTDGRKQTYLVGDRVTLADIMIVGTILYPLKLTADEGYVKPYPNVLRWFRHCVEQHEFQQVVGTVTMCKEELVAPGQKGGKDGKNGGGGGGGDMKEETKKKKVVIAGKKKLSGQPPLKGTDRDSPATAFSLDGWKKIYGEATSYDEELMNKFWDTYDHGGGYSLWTAAYKYNHENKRLYTTCKAVEGFQRRSEDIRSSSFAVTHVSENAGTAAGGGEGEGKGTGSFLEIAGLWLLRGDGTEHLFRANEDANWYVWTKIAGKNTPPTDDVKKLVSNYWCSRNELDGKPIRDTKVFQ